MLAALAKAKTKAESAKAHEKTNKAAAKVKSDMQLKLRAAKVAAAKKASAAARKAAVLRRKKAVLRLKMLASREGSAKKVKTAKENASKRGSIAQLKAKLNKATSTLRAKLRKQRNATPAARRLKRLQRRSARRVRRAARAAHRAARRKLHRSKRKLRHLQVGADAVIRKTGRSDARSLRKQAAQKKKAHLHKLLKAPVTKAHSTKPKKEKEALPMRRKPPTTMVLQRLSDAINSLDQRKSSALGAGRRRLGSGFPRRRAIRSLPSRVPSGPSSRRRGLGSGFPSSKPPTTMVLQRLSDAIYSLDHRKSDALRKQAAQKPLRQKPPTTMVLQRLSDAIYSLAQAKAARKSNARTRVAKKPSSNSRTAARDADMERRVRRTLERMVRRSKLEKARTIASVHALEKEKRTLRTYQRVERGHYKTPHAKPFVLPKLKKFTVPKHALPKSVRHAYRKLKKKEEEVAREEDALLSPFTVSYKATKATKKATKKMANAAVPIGLQGGQLKKATKKAKHSGAARISAGGVWLPFLLVLTTIATRH